MRFLFSIISLALVFKGPVFGATPASKAGQSSPAAASEARGATEVRYLSLSSPFDFNVERLPIAFNGHDLAGVADQLLKLDLHRRVDAFESTHTYEQRAIAGVSLVAPSLLAVVLSEARFAYDADAARWNVSEHALTATGLTAGGGQSVRYIRAKSKEIGRSRYVATTMVGLPINVLQISSVEWGVGVSLDTGSLLRGADIADRHGAIKVSVSMGTDEARSANGDLRLLAVGHVVVPPVMTTERRVLPTVSNNGLDHEYEVRILNIQPVALIVYRHSTGEVLSRYNLAAMADVEREGIRRMRAEISDELAECRRRQWTDCFSLDRCIRSDRFVDASACLAQWRAAGRYR